MKAALHGAAGLLFLAGSAAAQVPAAPVAGPTMAGPTMLHLSATGSVQATPDLLVADLVAQATATTPAAAQRRVNAMIAAGLQTARTVAGIDVQAIGYTVGPADEKNTSWTAQQTLELRGGDGPGLLDLVGRLQATGLAAGSIDWQLSPAARRRAEADATADALRQLQSRSGAAATTLGLKPGRITDVRLDDSGMPFQPRPMMMRAAVMEAPQASQGTQAVTATASADVELHP